MLKEKSVRVESMDEIVFAQRNREYGAYDLRKRYKKNVSKSLIVALIILIFTAGAPFIMALKNRGQKNIIDETIQANLMDVKAPDEEPPPPPPPPPPPEQMEAQVKFTAPLIVDTVDEKVEIATTEEIINTSTNEEVVEEVVETNAVIQEEEEVINFYVIEEKPGFPGGEEAMIKWISANVKYPEIAKENGITGKVFVQFVINKEGKVTDVQVIRGVDPYLDKEAVRVVSDMPAWTPGKQRGKTVKVSFQLPINFKLY